MDTLESERRLLHALLDTAADLAELRDTESVLTAIVRRTRGLLGTDMAYISLNDHASGWTFIRKSEGVVTPEYRNIRMPIDSGVLGRVAAGHSPFQSSDYLADETITHLPAIDADVAREGVRAIMGSPMVVGGIAIGALMVAERRARTFSPAEVTLVESLSKHAAVALNNATRYSDALSSARHADRSRQDERTRLEELDRLTDLAIRQCEALLTDPSISGVIHRAAEFLDRPLAVVDLASGTVTHTARPVATDHAAAPGAGRAPLETAATGLIRRLRSLTGDAAGGVHLLDPEGPRPVTVTPVPRSADRTVWLVADGALPSAAAERALFRTAQHAALADRLLRRSREDAVSRSARILGGLLAAGAEGPRRRTDAIAELGLDQDAAVGLIVVEFAQPPDPDAALRVLGEVMGVRLAARWSEDTWLLLTQGRGALARVRSAIRPPLPPSAHLAHLAEGGHLADVDAAVRSLERALRVARVTGSALPLEADTVGVLGAAFEQEDSAALLQPIRPLWRLPRERRDPLVQTAVAYLQSGASIAETARALFLHRNTVKQRLARLTVLLGEGWAVPPRGVDVYVALLAAAAEIGQPAVRPPERD